MEIKKTLLFGLQAKFIIISLTIAFLMIGIAVVGAFGIQNIVENSNRITEEEIPQLRSLRELVLAVSSAQSNIEGTLDVDKISEIEKINKYESTFRKSVIKFDMYMAALTWGSESEAFATSDYGINVAEWRRIGLKDILKVKQVSPEEIQIAGQASIYFAGFRNNAVKATSAWKKYLRLQEEGKSKEAELAYEEARAYSAKTRKYNELTISLLNEVIAISNTKVDQSAKQIWTDQLTTINRMIAIGVLGILLALIFNIFFTRLVVTKPLNYLIYFTNQFVAGNLNQRVNIKSHDEIGQLADVFNEMAAKLQEFYGGLEEKVKARTGELTQILSQIKVQNKEQEDSKKAILNLLEDAKDLEEQLKIEKQSVELRVEERTRQLQEEHVKLKSSIDSLSAGFIMLDTKKNIVIINPVAKEILCLADRQLLTNGELKRPAVGKQENDLDVIKKTLESSFVIEAAIDECLNRKNPVELKEVHISERYFHVFVSPILTYVEKNFQTIGVVILFEDITEGRILQRARDEFFSIASHELRTPLSAIRGNTSLIRQFYGATIKKDQQFREMIDDIHESSIRLIGIVNDFLNMSRLEVGRMVFKKEKVELPPIIDKVVEELTATSSAKKLYLKFERPREEIPQVIADPDKVKEVLINLVGNSMKFTEKGGISIDLKPQNGFVKILVRDTGIGIPPENYKLLFRKFQQAETNIYTRDNTKGTGLGLYISMLIVKNMGGEIKLESSKLGQGSTFSFTLPKALEEKKVISQKKPIESGKLIPAQQ